MPAQHGGSQPWLQVSPGVRQKVLVQAAEARLLLYEVAPDRQFAAHSHPEAQFGLILQGGGRHSVDGSLHRAEAGDSYYVPPNVLHDFHSNPGMKTMIVEIIVTQGPEEGAAVVAERLSGPTKEAAPTTQTATNRVAKRRRPEARQPDRRAP